MSSLVSIAEPRHPRQILATRAVFCCQSRGWRESTTAMLQFRTGFGGQKKPRKTPVVVRRRKLEERDDSATASTQQVAKSAGLSKRNAAPSKLQEDRK